MRNTLLMRYPAAWHGDMWREAIPVGNGELGGLVYGGVYKEYISIIHGKLWTGAKTPPLPDVSYTVKEMRKLLSENKPREAESIMSNELLNLGYDSRISKPLPLCDIEIITSNNKGFKNYRRSLDMETAEADVSWKDGEVSNKRRFFISRENDTACLIQTAEGGDLNTEITLKIHDEETLLDTEPPALVETNAENGKIYFAAQKDGKDFGGVAKVLCDGQMEYKDGKVFIKNASQVTVFAKFFIYGDRKKDWVILDKELVFTDYEVELRKHISIHKPLFNAQKFSLYGENYEKSNEELMLKAYDGEAPIELIEKLWSFGRYLLICASRKNGYPCQLYGVWAGGYKVNWAFNMLNVNLQMIYWQALPGGMPDLCMAVFDYLESKMDDYRENAKKLYGCRGINIPSVSTPESGLHKMKALPHILQWTGAAAWMAQHYFDYYLFTGDEEFLKERALPFMFETAEFYEDFVVYDENGKIIFTPSVSPENSPGNIKTDYVSIKYQVAVNATMDIALLKELLTNLIKGSSITGKYNEKVPVWKKMISRLPDYQINSDGAIKEWTHPFYEDNYEHRHQSHVYPVFPGFEYTRNSGKEIYKAFERAIELREGVGLKDQSGWSLMYMANVYGRMGKGDKALNLIDYLTRSVLLPNMFMAHNDWRRMGIAICDDLRVAPIQVDANMGLTSAILEMLVFSTETEIYLFNAMPERFTKGEAGPIKTRTRTEINLSWDEKNATARLLHNGEERKVTLILPENMTFFDSGMTKKEVILSKNKEIEFRINIKG